MYTYKSSGYFGSICIPDLSNTTSLPAAVGSAFTSQYATAANSAHDAIASLYSVWGVILASLGIAIVISLAYNCCIRFFVGFLVWFVVLAVIVGSALSGYSLIRMAQTADRTTTSDTSINAMYALGITALAVGAICLLMALFLRNQINIAIEVIKIGSEAVGDM